MGAGTEGRIFKIGISDDGALEDDGREETDGRRLTYQVGCGAGKSIYTIAGAEVAGVEIAGAGSEGKRHKGSNFT